MEQRYISADFPLYEGKKVPHLRVSGENIAPFALLPGDPGRVNLIGDHLMDQFTILSDNREFRIGTGRYQNLPVTVCSTGIGGPSTEIAVMELIQLGVKYLIRIGGTAAIQEGIECGDLIINTGSVRLGGTSSVYARIEYPAVANFHVVKALVESCEELGFKYHVGIGGTTSSFYHAQGRTLNEVNYHANIVEELRGLKVLNLEMESETLLTLASVMGVFAATICVVHCNRITNKWLVDYEESQMKLCKVALHTVQKLSKNGVK